MAERFLRSYGLDHLRADPRFASNSARVTHSSELDAEVARAIGARTLAENIAIAETNELTACAVQTVADVERHPHWQARGLAVDVPDNGGWVRMQSVVPRLSHSPGEICWAGGDIGQDNEAVYTALGLSGDEQQQLRANGVI
jgi:crotonobetainyl-CoA:carnitine CoA-transferase CaiB-like acyl-CoA transferase